MKKVIGLAFVMLAIGLFTGCANMRHALITNPGSMKSLSAFKLGVPENQITIQNNQLSEYQSSWDAVLSDGTVAHFQGDPFMNNVIITTNNPSATIKTISAPAGSKPTALNQNSSSPPALVSVPPSAK